MPIVPMVLIAGVAAGLVAAGVMEAFQTIAATPFGATSEDDPSTVKAADSVSRAIAGAAVAPGRRAVAGRLVHYATGAALGLLYVALVEIAPVTALGFGAAFGIVAAMVLDDLLVPAFGWGSWPTATPLNIHAYSLASHVVFGLALDGARRAIAVLPA